MNSKIARSLCADTQSISANIEAAKAVVNCVPVSIGAFPINAIDAIILIVLIFI